MENSLRIGNVSVAVVEESEAGRALHRCLVAPLPEHELAADLLSDAANAILARDLDLARDLVRRANIPALREHAGLVMGGRHPELLPRRQLAEPAVKTARVAARMPPGRVVASLYARDGWRCRFCGCRVVPGTARKAMKAAVPDAIAWGETEGYHGAFYALTASPDHVVPHSVGGSNDEENVVTACWSCQFGRGNFRLEEFGLIDPRLRPPVTDGWDGLTRLLHTTGCRASAPAARETPPSIALRSCASAAERLASLHAIRPDVSSRLIGFVEACADLDVSWSLNEVLLIRLTVGSRKLNLVGVQPGGKCEIPWSIGDAKDAIRVFAENLAGGIPGAIFYETPRMWMVRKPPKQQVDVLELLEALPALREALEALRSELLRSEAC